MMKDRAKSIRLKFIVSSGAMGVMLLGCGDGEATDDSTDSTLPYGDAGSIPNSGEDGTQNDPNGETGESPTWPQEKYISIDELYSRVQSGDSEMLLMNVSDEEFYNMGHIEGTVKIPWDTLSSRLDEVDRDKHIVIYCRRGVRSESAYDTLIGEDYPFVWVMEGGLEQWIEKGYPVVPDGK